MSWFKKKEKEKEEKVTQEEIMQKIKSVEINKWDVIRNNCERIKEDRLGGWVDVGFGWNANVASLEALLELKKRIEDLEKERDK